MLRGIGKTQKLIEESVKRQNEAMEQFFRPYILKHCDEPFTKEKFEKEKIEIRITNQNDLGETKYWLVKDGQKISPTFTVKFIGKIL